MANIDKAGAPSQISVVFRTDLGVPVVYADKTAFELAGWSVFYVVGGVEVTPSYTVEPSPVASLAGSHSLLTPTQELGTGSLIVVPPTDYTMDFTNQFGILVEANNRDDIVSLLLSSQGQPLSVGSSTSVRNFTVIEGDSFLSPQFSVPLIVFTNLGLLAADLNDPAKITHVGQVRAGDNARDEPNAYLEVCFISEDGTDAFFTIGWGEYPEAVSGVQEGMSLGTTDADTNSISFNWDFDSEGNVTVGTISAAVAGAGGQLTFPANCWANGQKFSVVGGANAGSYTTASFTRAGSDVTVTVIAADTIPSAVAGGDVTQTKTITPANGSINVQRQETQR